ncbi:hypothetical protein BC828DRAFT_416891 [Blastocladiella britannica]|nr:hypothetical protein BC828DRAFT_416891 [Blastocladiella britannica]
MLLLLPLPIRRRAAAAATKPVLTRAKSSVGVLPKRAQSYSTVGQSRRAGCEVTTLLRATNNRGVPALEQKGLQCDVPQPQPQRKKRKVTRRPSLFPPLPKGLKKNGLASLDEFPEMTAHLLSSTVPPSSSQDDDTPTELNAAYILSIANAVSLNIAAPTMLQMQPSLTCQWIQALASADLSPTDWNELLDMDSCPLLPATRVAAKHRQRLDLYHIQLVAFFEAWVAMGTPLTRVEESWLISNARTYASSYRMLPPLLMEACHRYRATVTLDHVTVLAKMLLPFQGSRANDLIALVTDHPQIAPALITDPTVRNGDLMHALVLAMDTIGEDLPLDSPRDMGSVFQNLSHKPDHARTLLAMYTRISHRDPASTSSFTMTRIMAHALLRAFAMVNADTASGRLEMVRFFHEAKTRYHLQPNWNTYNQLLHVHLKHDDLRGALFFFYERHNYLVSLSSPPTSTHLTALAAPTTTTTNQTALISDHDPDEDDGEHEDTGAAMPHHLFDRYVLRDSYAAALLRLIAAHKDHAKVRDFFDFLRVQGYPIDPAMLETYTTAFAHQKRLDGRLAEFAGIVSDVAYANAFVLMALGGGYVLDQVRRWRVERDMLLVEVDPGSEGV